MSNLPWFKFNPSHFVTDVQEWTPDEKGHHITLLCYQWIEGSLPTDIRRLELISPGISEIWDNISHKYQEVNGRLYNRRLEREREELSILKQAQSDGGRKGASKRWANESANEPANRSPNPTPNGITDNRTQNTEIEKKEGKRSDNTELTVLSFFSDYPSLYFPSMSIPRILEINLSLYGERAVRYILDQLVKIEDPKKRYSPQYVKKVIENAPLLKIKNGDADEQGQEVKAFTRDEALAWCDKNAGRMDKHFTTRRNGGGEPEKFEDGKAKLFLVTPTGAKAQRGARA